ncbi:HD domain-containing protein [Desulfovibrio sp. OttesenSCG-928-I05]|nr:HD domain-containing protein [Desulfovibrio sp. OttesenSCG-928-I05]
MLTRDEALERVRAQNPDIGLFHHALASEAVMRALAEKMGEDVELWGITGLVHDVDFPLTKDEPAKHGVVAQDLLGDLPEEARGAILAHNGEMTGTMPSGRFDYALRCAETVTGLISAAALVRPEGLHGMQAKSLKKKMKDKAFAASVNRDNIRECEHIAMTLDEFLELAVAAMLPLEKELGLAKS